MMMYVWFSKWEQFWSSSTQYFVMNARNAWRSVVAGLLLVIMVTLAAIKKIKYQIYHFSTVIKAEL